MGLAQMKAILVVVVLAGLLTACGDGESRGADVAVATSTLGPLPAVVPPLPFADNPDPEACGIPREWGRDEPGQVTGLYAGELIQPVVYLYDSHLRREVVGQIPDGGRVEILLSQSNPVLDYYLVRSIDLGQPQEGWIPAPFLNLG